MDRDIYTLTGLSKSQWIRNDPTIPPCHKVFDIGSGRYRYIIKNIPQHYWTEQGEGERPDQREWDDIDTTLRQEIVEGKTYPSQFIADKNNFSAGFRTDGNPHKFSGFRLNEANQYETSLYAIELNGSPVTIPETLGINQTDGNILEHVINDDIRVWNVVHPCFVRDAIKTTQFVNDFIITYQVHLKGFVIANDFNVAGENIEFIPDEKGDFVLVGDTSTGRKSVTIPKPMMWTDDPDAEQGCCFEINHRLYEQNGVLYYQKFPNDLGKDWLLANKPTLYIDGTIYYEYSSDHAGFIKSGADWDEIHDADSADIKTGHTGYFVGSYYSKGVYKIYRNTLTFNTSGIGSSKSIDSAVLYLTANTVNDANTKIGVYQGFHASPPISSDYVSFGTTQLAVSTDSWLPEVSKGIPLNSDGINAINKTGNTKLFLREEEHDVADVPPTADKTLYICTAHYGGSEYDPYLDITTISGGVVDCNATWKIFKKYDYDIAWKLLKILDQNTAWKIFNIKELYSVWRILVELIVETSSAWKIFKKQDQSLAWNLLNIFSKNFSWKIFKGLNRDTAWKVFNIINRDTAWKLFESIDQNVVWKVLNSLDQNVAWKLLVEKHIDIAWDILGALVTNMAFAWKILNTKDHSLTWKILRAFNQSITWKTFNAKSMESAWGILIVFDRDTAWKVCNASDIDSEWKVYGTLDKSMAWDICTSIQFDSGWKVMNAKSLSLAWSILGTIIPEPLKKFVLANPTNWAFVMSEKGVWAFNVKQKTAWMFEIGSRQARSFFVP